MSTSTADAALRVVRTTMREADRADRTGQRNYAALLRESARSVLAEYRAAAPRLPVTSADKERREKARAIAAVLLAGMH